MNINIYVTYIYRTSLNTSIVLQAIASLRVVLFFKLEQMTEARIEESGTWNHGLGGAPPTGLIYSWRDIKATDEKPVQVPARSVTALSRVAMSTSNDVPSIVMRRAVSLNFRDGSFPWSIMNDPTGLIDRRERRP